jgi:hypothetical protein
VTAKAQLPLQRQPCSPPRQRLRATETGLPLVGPRQPGERQHQNKKTSYERKTKKRPRPRRGPASRWSALRRPGRRQGTFT